MDNSDVTDFVLSLEDPDRLLTENPYHVISLMPYDTRYHKLIKIRALIFFIYGCDKDPVHFKLEYDINYLETTICVTEVEFLDNFEYYLDKVNSGFSIQINSGGDLGVLANFTYLNFIENSINTN